MGVFLLFSIETAADFTVRVLSLLSLLLLSRDVLIHTEVDFFFYLKEKHYFSNISSSTRSLKGPSLRRELFVES